MITPARSSFRYASLVAGCALIALGYSALPLYAAPAADPVPSVIINVNKSAEKLQAAPRLSAAPVNNNKNNNKNQQQQQQPVGPSSSSSSSVTYTISIKNSSKFPAKNLAVEYHFYNKTTVTVNGLGDSSINDITSTENVDIDTGKTKDIESQPISKSSSLDSAKGNNGGSNNSKAKTSAVQTQSSTSLLGWHVEVKYNDKVIAKKDSPDNLQDLLKHYTSK